ncbi:hypothetical protein PENSPDRAFT_680566 [Peniophora sp. CONT]|nr:hypothetical protein PENSPDRAFT_680566 [Peniophora sp. CONT]
MDRYLDEDMPEWLLDFILSGMPNMTDRDRQLHADLQTVMRYRRSNGGQASRLTSQEVLQISDSLPKLSEEDLSRINQRDGTCPICMNTLLAAIADEEFAQVMDSPMLGDLGVTRTAETCGHTFCRRCLLTWIRDGHSTCPMCRTPFIKAVAPSSSTEQTSETDDEFEAALSRIVTAYQEERTRIGAAPMHPGSMTEGLPSAFTMFGAPLAAPNENEYSADRSDFSGMYS